MFSTRNAVMVSPSRPIVAAGISMRVHVSSAGTVELMKVHEPSPPIAGAGVVEPYQMQPLVPKVAPLYQVILSSFAPMRGAD